MTVGVVPWFESGAGPAGTIVVVAVIVAVIAGVVWAVRGRGLLAAIVLFASLAVALLVGALAAAHVPEKLFSGALPSDTDAAWKAAQTIVLSLGFVGIVITGVVGYHRQRIAQQQAEQDRDRLGLDRRTRQHERFAKGSEMMAADAPEMRIAGLNVIAALGAEVEPEDELRQTCINLICAYLRKNSPAVLGRPVPVRRAARSQRAAELAAIGRYRAVTEEACRLLPTLFETAHDTAPAHRRFRHTPDTRPTALDLDLRNTTLIDITFSQRLIGTARFEGASFVGVAGFGGASFVGVAGFEGASFVGVAGFEGASFSRVASFGGASFGGVAGFGGASFGGVAGFGGARFSRVAWFERASFVGDARFVGDAGDGGASFGGDARFGGASFVGAAWFGGASFSRVAWFEGASFVGAARFERASFGGEARFGGASFAGAARFVGASFVGDAQFDRVTFRGAGFGAAIFDGVARFDLTTFNGEAGFGGASFGGVVGFERTTFSRVARFEGARFVSYDNAHHDHLKGAVFVGNPERPFPGAVYGPAPGDRDDSREEPA